MPSRKSNKLSVCLTTLCHRRNFSVKKTWAGMTRMQRQSDNKTKNAWFPIASIIATSGAIVYVANKRFRKSYPLPYLTDSEAYEMKSDHTQLNWSGTHSVDTMLYEPESVSDLERLVSYCHEHGLPLRPTGTGISPNGLSFRPEGMVSLSHLNEIISINPQTLQVTCEAGASLAQLLRGINNESHRMTVQNIPSIQVQQLGGLMSVGAHGTGLQIPPCDEQIIEFDLITPSQGKMTLRRDDTGEKNILFHLARVGLGCLGVVSRVVLQCVPQYYLCERTFVLSHQELLQRRNEILTTHKHARWMWVPYSKDVVVVASNPVAPESKELNELNQLNGMNANEGMEGIDGNWRETSEIVGKRVESALDRMGRDGDKFEEVRQQRPLRELYCKRMGLDVDKFDTKGIYNFADMRDKLLGIEKGANILDTQWVRQVNAQEAQFWKNSSCEDEKDALVSLGGAVVAADQLEEMVGKQGVRVDNSEKLLSFDCGGQQWVYEVVFPLDDASNPKKSNTMGNVGKVLPNDVRFVMELLQEIERNEIPAPSPIEHRYTARSTSLMSPAYSEDEDAVFAWVGVIYYIPTHDEEKREEIAKSFAKYSRVLEKLCDKYGAVGHWAKIEACYRNEKEIEECKARLKRYYSDRLDLFQKYRKELDPKGILANDVVDTFF